MNAERRQGLIFGCVACLATAAAGALGRCPPQLELIVLAALILVLGVPHGAMDTLFAQRLYGLRTAWDWTRFTAGYLVLAGLVVAAWAWAPTAFLVGFLLISVAHFSGDPAEGTPWISRILYGGVVLVLPAGRHQAEMSGLFGQLVGPEAAGAIMPVLGWLVWPWALGLIVAIGERSVRDRLTAFEFAAVGMLAFVAPPLLAFTLFFCGMHGARHILRAFRYSGRDSWRFLGLVALLPMIGVGLGSAAAWYFLQDAPLDARVVQIVFVGLAALTVPHMVLVERVRLAGWIRPPSA
ncbi:MAG: Brp/Blh family beta-carotene 15,15'-dioxygenase [Verrucomicrobiota bacterium]|jgi:Brp/Blh family beta-carotene 15,15'-monooxygenase